MTSIFTCCFFKKYQQNAPKYLIKWEQTKPFVPPIEEGEVIKVYDGDTITIAAKLPYNASPLYRFQVRLLGIDSPEMNGKSQEEREAAQKSQKALEDLVLHKTVYLKDCGNEKYGRLLANVYIDEKERINVNHWMIENGYAVEYRGGTKIPFATSSGSPKS
jgi:endonuclease YncB( thermonuclease family)